MKWMITGDWELMNERVDTARVLGEYIVEQFESSGFDRLIFVGDMFREFTASTAIAAAETIAHMDGQKAPILIVGNHDREVGADRLTAIFGDSGVIGTPKVIDLDGVKVGILPAPDRAAFGASRGAEGRRTRDQALSEALEAALISLETQIGEENLSKAVLFFHASIGGAELGKQRLPRGLTWEIPLARLERWGLAIGGHIHRPQQMADNVYYAGGIAPWTFSDKAEQFRAIALEIMDGSFRVESIPLPRVIIPIEIELDREGFKNGGEEAYPTDGNFASTLFGFLVDRCGVKIGDRVNLKIRAKLSPDKLQALPTEEELKGKLNVDDSWIVDLKIAREPVGLCKARIDADREDMNLEELFGVWREASENEIAPEIEKTVERRLSDLEELYRPGEGNFGFKPLELTIKNFRQWDDASIDFEELDGSIAITGDNAVGKSNLLEAVLFALFKRSPSSTASIEDELRLGEREGKVVLTFEAGGRAYLVRRALERTGSGVSCKSEFFDDDTNPVCETANDIDKKIAELVGSYEFVISTFFGTQKEIDRLVDATFSEWNKLFLDSLALERFEPLRETADKKAKLLEGEITKLETRIDELEQQTTVEEAELQDQPDVGKLQAMKAEEAAAASTIEASISDTRKYKELQGLILSKLQMQRQERDELVVKIDSLKKRIEAATDIEDIGERPEVPQFDGNIDEAKAMIIELKKGRDHDEEELSKRRSKKATLQGGLESIGDQVKRTEAQIAELDEKIAQATEARANLEAPPCVEWDTDVVKLSDSCPAWKAYTGGDHIERIQKERTSLREKLESLWESSIDNETMLDQVEKEIEHLGLQLSVTSDKIRGSESRLGDYENALKAAELWDEKMKAQKVALTTREERKAELQEIQAKLVSFADISEQIKAAEKSIARLQSEIDEKNEALKRRRDAIGAHASQLAKIEQLEAALKAKQERLEGYRREIMKGQLDAGAWRVLATAFHRTGIPYLLMERMIGAFEDETNKILRPTDLSVTIETMTSTKKGEARDKIKVSFNDPRGQHPLAKASGYQRAVLGMALRAAMAAVGARFWGAVPEIYVQDEGWERFNSRRHDIARELIASIAERFTRFFYITHVEPLADSADIRIRVEGENGRSVIAS